MEVMRPDDEYFVNDADLSLKRPPPNQSTGIRELIQSDIVQRVAGGFLILLIILLWPNIRMTLVDVGLLPSDAPDLLVDLGVPPSDAANLLEGIVLGALTSLPFAVLVLIEGLRVTQKFGIPVYRNIIFLRDAVQVIFLLVIITIGYFLITNLQDNFADPETGLRINFGVLTRDFGVEVSEGPRYTEDIEWLSSLPIVGEDYFRGGTYSRALLTGLYNTIQVVVIALFFTTILGVLVGIGLLSGNWLVRAVAGSFVEVFRNTPLLVQLFLIYGVWIRILPPVRESLELPGPIYLNNRGLNYPAFSTTDSFVWLFALSLIGFGIGIGLWRWRLRVQERTGEPARALLFFLSSFVGLSVLGYALAVIIGGQPIVAEFPEPLDQVRFNIEQGASFSPEFTALTLTLVLYTAAFIADIVRAGILSVPKGQIEAARAAGLTGGQTLSLVVLPQAMRLIIPPLTNQYLNLSKNSSLAIAVGYVDLFNVSNIAANQSGQAVVFFAVVLVIYLIMSLLISLVMNFVNRGLRLQTR